MYQSLDAILNTGKKKFKKDLKAEFQEIHTPTSMAAHQ